MQEYGIQPPKGKITVWSVDENTGEKVELFSQYNQIQYYWGYVVAKTAGQGDASYRLSTCYFEYSNVVTPGDTVTAPTYTRGDGLSYYTGLSAPNDYLRLTLPALPSITIEAGYESYFTAPAGNVMNFYMQTSGTTGMLGRPFSSANNSTVYGLALLAAPVTSDATQDVLFARSYLSAPNQQLKVSGKQIGVTWTIPLL